MSSPAEQLVDDDELWGRFSIAFQRLSRQPGDHSRVQSADHDRVRPDHLLTLAEVAKIVLVTFGLIAPDSYDPPALDRHQLVVRSGEGVPVVEEIASWVSSEPAN